jgi:hypothetical protein
MGENIAETVLIDPQLASYEKFFDHEWAKRTFEAVKNSPLEDAVDDLIVTWRSADGAHRLPWLMVETLRQYADGEFLGNLQFRANHAQEVIKRVVNKIEDAMQYHLKLDQRSALKRAVSKMEKEAFVAVRTAREQIKMDVPEYWQYLIAQSEFHFSILGTQRINYGSLFFSYEDFLANTIRTRDPAYSSKTEPIKVAFPRHFGVSLTDYCWNHDEVELAKLVRNALAHNGGRFGKDLQKFASRFVDTTGLKAVKLQNDLFLLVDGKIQITPGNTRHLFGLLKERVSKLVEAII